MEDNYLDNVFREKLELPQHHDFNESAWLDLESRLEEKPIRRIVWWRWAAAVGILLPMLLSSFYFYNELKQTEMQLANLETRMNRFLKKDIATIVKEEEANVASAENAQNPRQATDNSVTASISSNTEVSNNIQKRAAALPNTFYKNINKGNNVISTFVSEGNTVSMNMNLVTAKGAEQNQPQRITETINRSKEYATNPTYLSANNEAYSKGFPIPNTNTVNSHNWISKERTLVIKESAWTKAQRQFIPIGFEIGANVQGGIVLSQTLSSRPLFNNEGVKAAVNLANSTDLTLGANYAAYSYETQNVGIDFPNVQPKNTDDLFQKTTVAETVIQVPVGLKYNFGYSEDVFSPFVEIGGIAKKSIQKTYKYEYLPTQKPSEPYAISPKPQKTKERLAMNTATASLGVKWNPNLPKAPILDNMIVQAEVFGNADFETENTQWMAGVGISMSYAF
jgi:biotin carboxyl carrier protein